MLPQRLAKACSVHAVAQGVRVLTVAATNKAVHVTRVANVPVQSNVKQVVAQKDHHAAARKNDLALWCCRLAAIRAVVVLIADSA